MFLCGGSIWRKALRALAVPAGELARITRHGCAGSVPPVITGPAAPPAPQDRGTAAVCNKGKAALSRRSYSVPCLIWDTGDRAQLHLIHAQPQRTILQHEQSCQCILSCHISAIKTLIEAVKDIFLHPTTDGHGFNIGIGLPACPGRENQSENPS